MLKMGRTRRKRNRRSQLLKTCINIEESVIALNKWMKRKGWKNHSHLKLAFCKNTGRGIISTKTLNKFDTLIQVPYNLMISLTTIETSNLQEMFSRNAGKTLQMQDILSLYLMLEKHKESNSEWKFYVDLLPKDVPPVPWLCTDEEAELLPSWLKSEVIGRRWKFEESWNRVKESINPKWECACCKNQGHRVLTLPIFRWAYTMVNTRAVYVDPHIVRELSFQGNLCNLLSDDPCMALCPFLDMFNHCSTANSQAGLKFIGNAWHYTLQTFNSFAKYNEIFISYGAHDNIKLLCEYGFFIPEIQFDCVNFSFKDVLSCTKIPVNERQYKFICDKFLPTGKLFLSASGISFSLKAVFYVMLCDDVKLWSANIFSGNYTEDFQHQACNFAKILLQETLNTSKVEYCCVEACSKDASKSFRVVRDFLCYRITFIQHLVDNIFNKIN